MPDPGGTFGVGRRILSAPAPAKINLVLEILGRREDRYHELDTILQTLELADTVTIEFDAAEPDIVISGPFGRGVPIDDSNLAFRVLVNLGLRTSLPFGRSKIRIEKRVPAAAGLGGGASDAATVLRLIQRAYPEVTDADLMAVATGVGSDETALLLGGTVRARGRGTEVEPAHALPRCGVLLFIPDETLPRKTAALFEAFDRVGVWGDGMKAETFGAHLETPWTALHNDFEQVAFSAFPGLDALREATEAEIEAPVHLAGAGPTLYWLGPEVELEEKFERATAKRHYRCTIIPTATAPSLWQR